MKISDAQFDQCRRMFDAIDPDRLRPLYLLRSEDVGDTLRDATSDCMGWAVAGSRVCAFADVLGERWQGVGDAIVLDADVIASASLPGEFERCVLNVAVHELAHVLPPLPPLPVFADYVPTDGAKEFACRRLRDSMTEAEPEPGSERDCHGWQFCRRAIHCWYRATVAGFDVPLFRLFGGRFGMSDATWYLPTLLAEVAKMRDETFGTIDQTPPPARFMVLWEADLFDMRRFACTEVGASK